MKVGPLELRRYEDVPKKKPEVSEDRRELGQTGTAVFSGLIFGSEYNNDLRGEAGILTYEKMFKSDGTVRAVEKAVTLPIRAAQWSVEPASDSAQDKEVAEFVDENLHHMSITFDDVLRHVLYMLRYGFYLLEPVYEMRDGKFQLRKLAPRHPKTIHRWYIDDHGGLTGIQQRVWRPVGGTFGTVASGTFDYIDIPIDRLLVHTYEREGTDWHGESMARPMYKPWYLKEGVERILAIGAERREVGVEFAKMSENATKAQEEAVVNALASLHAQENGYLVLPPTVAEQGILGQGAGRPNTMAFLEYLRREIAVSGLADFLTVGSTAGSWAMVRDKSSFFLLALRSVVMSICDVWNRHLIKPLVSANFAVKEFPEMTVTRLETRQVAEFATAIQSLAASGFLTPDTVTEEAVRREMDLPDKPEEEADAQQEARMAGLKLAKESPGKKPGDDNPFGEDEEEEDEEEEEEKKLSRRRRQWRGYDRPKGSGRVSSRYAAPQAREPKGSSVGGQFAGKGAGVPVAGSVTGDFNLTDGETESLKRYTTNDYETINGSLRSKDVVKGGPTVQNMDKAIAKHQLQEDTILHRGVNPFSVGGTPVTDLPIGTVFTDRGYVSTTAERGKAFRRGVSMEIGARKGQTALHVGVMPKNLPGGESEVLLPRNTSFRITGKRTDPSTLIWVGGKQVPAVTLELEIVR